MNTSSPRVKAALIGASALAAFGMILPAHADNAGGSPSGKGDSSVGNANPNGTPQGQVGNDNSNGWRCNNNNGAGQGNPAQAHACGPVDGGGGGDVIVGG